MKVGCYVVMGQTAHTPLTEQHLLRTPILPLLIGTMNM